MIDVKMARALIARLESSPETHDQNTWATTTGCGTVMCAAGHICDLAGAKFKWKPNETAAYVWMDSVPQYYDPTVSHYAVGYIPMVAQRILGIDSATRERLFFDAKTLDDIKAILLPLIAAAERGDRELDFTGDEGNDGSE